MTESAGSAAIDEVEWRGVLDGWRATRSNELLRAYSDCANTRLLRRWLPDLAGCKVLKTDLFDEAVGVGLYPALKRAGGNVVAVDVSNEVAAAALARYPELDATTGDLRRLAYESGTFDVVVSNSTLDHFRSLAEVERALDELQRVLRSGGRLVVTLDNPLHPLVALRNALPSEPLRRSGLVPYFVGATCGPRQLARLLRSVGLEVVDQAALMHFPRMLARPISHIASRDAVVRFLMLFERLGSLPIRYGTGQFVAALARKPPR